MSVGARLSYGAVHQRDALVVFRVAVHSFCGAHWGELLQDGADSPYLFDARAPSRV